MISRDTISHLAERAFAVEALVDTIYEAAKKLEELSTGPGERGQLAYKVSHLLHGASHLSGNLAHDLSDLIRLAGGDE